MECAFAACNTLNNETCIFIDENTHVMDIPVW